MSRATADVDAVGEFIHRGLMKDNSDSTMVRRGCGHQAGQLTGSWL